MRNESGEFELVVGNRQLLSGFFIIVVLFGVAFAMGYVVGQNSPRPAAASDASDPDPQTASRTPATPSAQPDDPDAPTPAPAVASHSGSSQRLVAGADLPPGSFWQLMAIPQPEAEAIGKTLRDKGFPAVLSPGPKHLTRVLVGPFRDTQSFGRAKSDLESAGFQGPVRYRRD